MASCSPYLLIVVNFNRGWTRSLFHHRITRRLAGITWALLLTHTTLNVPIAHRRHYVRRRGDRQPAF